MEKEIKSISAGNTADIRYIHQQYPWFSEEEIVDAWKKFDHRVDRVVAYLNFRSNNWSVFDLTEF